jgi:tight adherence protein C
MAELFNLQTLITLLAAIGSFGAILAFTLPYLQTDARAARLKAVAKRREELGEQQRSRFQEKSTRMLRAQRVGLMKKVVERLKLQNLMDSQTIRQRLVQAGKRGDAPRVVFAFARIVLSVVLAFFAVLFVFGAAGTDMALTMKIAIVAGATGIGFYLPSVLVSNMIQKRQQMLTKSFPDALDLMVICVEAGSSMEAAFNRVTEELSEAAPQLAEEFGLTSAELAFLSERRQALENLATRTGLASVKSFSTALIQSEKYGTPLAVSLRVLAQENRDSRMSAAEKKAAALPAKLTVPMILFFLPVLFIVLLAPAVIKALDTIG